MESSGLGLTKVPGSIIPDISEWDVVKSSEIRQDGKNYKTESLAKTEGTKEIPGGHAEYAGRNEHMKKASYQGDDKNFVKSSEESSKTQTQEKVVIGGENDGTIQEKSSSVTSSTQVKVSKHSSSNADSILDPQAIHRQFDELRDSDVRNRRHHQKEHQTSNVESSSSTVRREHQTREQHHEERQQHNQQHSQQTQSERYVTKNASDRNINQNTKSEAVKTKLRADEIDSWAAKPGQIISRTVEEVDANTLSITETKKLQDGTIVTTKRYEKKSGTKS